MPLIEDQTQSEAIAAAKKKWTEIRKLISGNSAQRYFERPCFSMKSGCTVQTSQRNGEVG